MTTGSRSGSANITFKYWDKLVSVLSGSTAVKPLNNGIDSSCVNEHSTNGDNIHDDSNISTSISSSTSNNDIAGASSSGSGINSTNKFNLETMETTSLHNNNNINDSETDPIVKK